MSPVKLDNFTFLVFFILYFMVKCMWFRLLGSHLRSDWPSRSRSSSGASHVPISIFFSVSANRKPINIPTRIGLNQNCDWDTNHSFHLDKMTNIHVIREIYAKIRENWLTTQKKKLNTFNITATKRYTFHNQYIITKNSLSSRESFPVETKVLDYQVNLIRSTTRLYIWTAWLL